MDFKEWLGDVLVQARSQRRARHGMPVVAHAARVQPEAIARRCLCHRRARGDGQHTGADVGGEETALPEKSPAGLSRVDRPTGRRQRVVIGPSQPRDIEIAAKIARNARQGGMFSKDFGGTFPAKGVAPSHSCRHIRDHAPVITRLARCRQKGALAADGAVGIGDSAGFFAPGRCRQYHVGQTCGVGLRHVADHDKVAALDGRSHRIGIGHRHGGIGVNDPQCLDPPLGHGAEHIDGFQAGRFRHRRAVPEALHSGAVVGILDIQMTGQHIGQAPHLAPAHGVRLAGHGKRPQAVATNAARRQMAIQDCVHLVGATLGLVDTLGIDRDNPLGRGEPVQELRKIAVVQPSQRGTTGARGGQRTVKSADMARDIIVIHRAAIGQRDQ